MVTDTSREALIKELRDRRAYGMNMHGFDISLLTKAADMLEADAAHMALSDLAGNAETMSIANSQIQKLKTQLAQRTAERDTVIRMAASGSEIYGKQAQQAQEVEPVGVVTFLPGGVRPILSRLPGARLNSGDKLYTHPDPPAQQVAAPAWKAGQQEPIPHSGADEMPPIFGRRWSLARDGFGLQRDDESGNYVQIDDAISTMHAMLAAAQEAKQ